MAAGIRKRRASKVGRLAIEIAITRVGLRKTNPEWETKLKQGESKVSMSTWRRFYSGKLIRTENFVRCCQVLELDWREIQEELPQSTVDAIAQDILDDYGKDVSLRIVSALKRLAS